MPAYIAGMQPIQFQTHFLQNGLKVLIIEDHSLPRVAIDIVYRVGSRNEDPSRTGFAHLFEHLMFGGSRNIPSYDTPLQRVGGDNNAFTNTDITNYYLTLPSNQIETGLWLESDRMLELDFSQKSLDVQKSVVIEEFKQRYLNRPYGDAHLLLRDLHFQVHPYRWSTIGKEISHIEQATLDDVKAFFYGFYAPNNATLVLAGDIGPESGLKLVEKWFGDIPARTLAHQPLPEEPAQQAARHRTVYKAVPYPAIFRMYHIPGRSHPDTPALEVLSELLSGGDSGLLYQEMVKKQQLVNSIYTYPWGAYDPGPFSLDAFLMPGVEPEQYESALTETLQRCMDNTAVADLERIKTRMEAQLFHERTTMLNKAMNLAIADSIGDPNLINSQYDDIHRVSLDDLHRVFTQYLQPANSSTLYYLPEEA